MSEWCSVYSGGMGEIEEKKSRFIANAEPVASEDEAASFVAAMKKKYWDARHNCSAYIVGDNGEKTRCSDDGEPSGTAGRPMLDVLANEHVTNVCVVVTRYFGGTLLGTGGLVRAYSAAVKAALANCEVIHKISGFAIRAVCSYNDVGKIQYLAAQKGYHIAQMDYSDTVTVSFLTDDEKKLRDDLVDITSGNIEIEEPEVVVYAVINGKPTVL